MNNKKTKIITECNQCGQRLIDWPYSTPCCGDLSVIVDENGKTTTKVFLSTLIKPKNKIYENGNRTN